MNVTVHPSRLSGTLSAIPSKSDAHRLLICAAFSDRPTKLRCAATSEDIEATCRCLTALGARIIFSGGCIEVTPAERIPPRPHLDCGESGSTLRFLLPVAAAVCDGACFEGRGRLPQRPLGDLMGAMKAHGTEFSAPTLPFTLSGRLRPGHYSLPGNVSSQYVTGLMLGLSLPEGDSRIELTTELESAGYIDITLSALERFGGRVTPRENGWLISGTGGFSGPEELAVDGDWSNAAFFLAAGALSGSVTLTGLSADSPQGDKSILSVLSDMGASPSVTENGVTVSPQELRGCTVDMRQIPDALPILGVLASGAKGSTRFVNASRLRLKESDRIATTAAMLKSLGISADEEPDGLTVHGGKLCGGTVDGAGDHRIVMAAAIAGTLASSPVRITGAEAVNKSYPTFFKDLTALGGIAYGF